MSNWLSVDPLAEKTMTPYQYVNQNPIRYIDPTGMESEDWGLKENQWEWNDNVTKGNYKDLGYDDYSDGITNNVYENEDGGTTTLLPDNDFSEKSELDPTTLNRNLMDHYVGHLNPENKDGSPNYETEPLSPVDARARAHDIGSDFAKAKGLDGVFFNRATLPYDSEFILDNYKDATTLLRIAPVTGRHAPRIYLEAAKSFTAGAVIHILVTPKALYQHSENFYNYITN